MPPPAQTGLSHWPTYEMVKYLRCEGIVVSHNFIAQLCREHGLKPHRRGRASAKSVHVFEGR
jgi:hypothetical protein